MKIISILISLLSLSGIYLFNFDKSSTATDEEIKIVKAYQAWKSEVNQNFNGIEDEYRFNEFKNNYKFIEQHNSENQKLTLGLTKFAAMSNSEYRENVLLRNKVSLHNENAQYYQSVGDDLPGSVNWKSKGAVYATQDQGSCGSCWAFSAMGALQGLRYIVDNVLELLSAQQITSCTPAEYLDNKVDGCGGGEAYYAFNYTAINGIESDKAYPYVDGSPLTKGTSPCEYNKKKVVFYNEGTALVKHNNVQDMKENLVNQPLSIGVDAASIFFQLYSDGILDSENCGIEQNHLILLYGYQTENTETPYWMVQNSWGTKWGQGGYGQVAITEGDGVCGINMQVAYPTSVTQKPSEKQI